MKVKELIERLQQFDGEFQVKIGVNKFTDPDIDIEDVTICSDDYGTTQHVSLWDE